jgi:hypothetical protein
MKRLVCALAASLAISCGGATIDEPTDAGRDARSGRSEEDAARTRDAASKPDVGGGGRRDAGLDASNEPADRAPDVADVAVEAMADVAIDRPADVVVDQGPDGGCAVDCGSLPNVRPGAPVECRSGRCYVPPGSCVAGFAHCTIRPEDGCETDLSARTSCGACGFVCYGSYRCAMSGGRYTCVLDCPMTAPDACFGICVDQSKDTSNCGACGHDCFEDNPHAEVSCSAGQCKVERCEDGFGDCTTEPGCESRLDTAENCGACGKKACSYANATSPCVATGCGEPVCNEGFGNCDRASPDCETPIGATGATCWPRYLGTAAFGGAPNQLTSAALLADGTHFVGGDFNRVADFDPGAGLDIRTPVAPPDAYVVKLAADGSLVWAKTIGGTGEEGVTAVAAGPDGSVILAGHYSGTADFDPGPGVDSHTSDSLDGFVVKLASDGTLVWARMFSGPGYHFIDAEAVAVAGDGSVYVGGRFEGGIDLDPGPGTTEERANSNGFLVKLNGAGAFVWGRALGGSTCTFDYFSGLALASDGSVWMSGLVGESCPLDPADSANEDTTDFRTAVGGFASSGDFRRAWRISAYGDRAPLTVGPDDAIYVGGRFTGLVDFDPGPNKVERSSGTDADGEFTTAGFVVKFGQDGVFRWVVPIPRLLVQSIAASDKGILALGYHLVPGNDLWGTELAALDTTGTSIFSVTLGNLQTNPGAVAASGARFVVVGQTDGLADFDPGAGTDIVDRGFVTFASRFSF